jgi:MFS family permease
VYSLGISLGASFAYLLGGMIIEVASKADLIVLPLLGELRGWQIVFLLAGLPGIVLAPLALLIREPERRGAGSAQIRAVPLRQVVAFAWARKKTFASLFLGLALVLSAGHGAGAWWPAYFVRVYDWPIGQIALWLGISGLTTAAAGTYFGGYLADRLQARGVVDATVRTCAIGVTIAIPLMVAAPLLPNPWMVLACNSVAQFFFMTPWGAAAAAVQLVTPNRLRGQMSALYLATINIIGLTLGPVIIGILNDKVFTGPTHIGMSMAVTWMATLTCGVTLLWTGLSSFRRDAAQMLVAE